MAKIPEELLKKYIEIIDYAIEHNLPVSIGYRDTRKLDYYSEVIYPTGYALKRKTCVWITTTGTKFRAYDVSRLAQCGRSLHIVDPKLFYKKTSHIGCAEDRLYVRPR